MRRRITIAIVRMMLSERERVKYGTVQFCPEVKGEDAEIWSSQSMPIAIIFQSARKYPSNTSMSNSNLLKEARYNKQGKAMIIHSGTRDPL